MDGPTLNLLSRFRAQVVSDVKSKLKDDSSSDTETENGPIETEDESETKTGSDTGSMTDSSICEPQPDIPGPRPTAILRRKSMVTTLGDGTSGLRRRNNVLRRRSDNSGVTFDANILESEEVTNKNDKPVKFNGRRKSVMFDLSNQKRRQSILKSPRKASMASTDASAKSVRFNDSDSDEPSS